MLRCILKSRRLQAKEPHGPQVANPFCKRYYYERIIIIIIVVLVVFRVQIHRRIENGYELLLLRSVLLVRANRLGFETVRYNHDKDEKR